MTLLTKSSSLTAAKPIRPSSAAVSEEIINSIYEVLGCTAEDFLKGGGCVKAIDSH